MESTLDDTSNGRRGHDFYKTLRLWNISWKFMGVEVTKENEFSSNVAKKII